MSKIRKARKLRTPNVPMVNVVAETRSTETRNVQAVESSVPEFDYTYTRKDLTRIGVLAASFITVLVLLSFFIR